MNAPPDSRRQRQVTYEGLELLAAGLGRKCGNVWHSQLGDDRIEPLPLGPRYGRRMRNVEDVAFLLDSVKATWRDWDQHSGLYHSVDASYASARERGLDDSVPHRCRVARGSVPHEQPFSSQGRS